MAHKAFPCNQHSPSLAELSFGEQMQQAQRNYELTASCKSRLNQEIHAQPDAVNAPGFEFSEEQLKQAWYRLNRDQRELLELYVAEGLTCAQIAERKQQSRAAVRRALSNVYTQLLLQLDSSYGPRRT